MLLTSISIARKVTSPLYEGATLEITGSDGVETDGG